MCCRKQTDCNDTNGGGNSQESEQGHSHNFSTEVKNESKGPQWNYNTLSQATHSFCWMKCKSVVFLGEYGFTADHHLPENHLQIWCDDTVGWCKNCLIYSCNMQHILQTLTNTVHNRSQHFSWVHFLLRQWVRWIFQTKSFCFSFPSFYAAAEKAGAVRRCHFSLWIYDTSIFLKHPTFAGQSATADWLMTQISFHCRLVKICTQLCFKDWVIQRCGHIEIN